jgi:large subunit ribosomal protein L30
MPAKKIRITLKKSHFGRKPSRSATLEALGLRRINQSVVVEPTPQIVGMTRKVIDLISVEEES